MNLKLLCAGDLHLGRRPSRLPAAVNQAAFPASKCWLDMVHKAIELEVDAVLLAGDVVDRENRYFEAFGSLEQGIRLLASHGIRVVAVAGNHDFDVLPKLARSFDPDQFKLLGQGGSWERIALTPRAQSAADAGSTGSRARTDGPALFIDGWSFPREHVDTNPLSSYNLDKPPTAPLIGLLHADLDQAQSRYAPVRGDDLLKLLPALWVLGHVHAPSLREEYGRPRLLYTGSPLAFSPKETGLHGPWLIEVEMEAGAGGEAGSGATGAAGRLTVRQVPLSRLRYDDVTVNLEGASGLDEVEHRVIEAVRRHLEDVVEAHGDTLECLVCRLRLVGRTAAHGGIDGRLAERAHELEVPRGGARAYVGDWVDETRPQWDLARLAQTSGVPGELARMLLALESPGSPERQRLLSAARKRLEDLERKAEYRILNSLGTSLEGGRGGEHREGLAATDEELAATLRGRGLLLLDALLAQKEVGAA